MKMPLEQGEVMNAFHKLQSGIVEVNGMPTFYLF